MNEKLELIKTMYEAEAANIAKYHAADEAGDSEGCKAAREAHEAWEKLMNETDKQFKAVYRLYESMKERGNDMIDFDEPYQYRNAAETVAMLREYGFDRFSFSSTWSSAVETAWLFTQNGCRLEGLVEINGRCKAFMSDEYEKKHGYLFSVQ